MRNELGKYGDGKSNQEVGPVEKLPDSDKKALKQENRELVEIVMQALNEWVTATTNKAGSDGRLRRRQARHAEERMANRCNH